MAITLQDYLTSLQGKRVAVIGIGVSNTPLIKTLLQAGISVTACDKAPRTAFGALADELESMGACLLYTSITFYVTPSITAIQTPLLASPCLKRRTPSSSLWKTKAVPFPRTNWIKSLNSFFGWIPLVPVLPAALAWGLPLPRRS